MKTYAPTADGIYVFPSDDRAPYPLEHHVYHSPDGYSWGYGGSGPTELAKDILWDLLGEQPAVTLYQAFKWRFITPLDQESNSWRITEDEIRSWLREQPENGVAVTADEAERGYEVTELEERDGTSR